jgi:hypothetical protein
MTHENGVLDAADNASVEFGIRSNEHPGHRRCRFIVGLTGQQHASRAIGWWRRPLTIQGSDHGASAQRSKSAKCRVDLGLTRLWHPPALNWIRGAKEVPMAEEVNDTWYVSYEIAGSAGKRAKNAARTTETFRNEAEARAFARARFSEGISVSAGTINPHFPKRTIASTQIHRWLQEF